MGGSIHQKKNRWWISIYFEGQRYWIKRNPKSNEPFHSKNSAQKQLSRIQTEIDDGEFHPKYWMPESPVLVPNYCNEWIKHHDVSRKTKSDYKGYIRHYINVYFEQKDIRQIRAGDIDKFLKWIPLSSKGKYNVVSCLRTILRSAYRNEDISRVPPFPVLRYEKPEIEYLTLEQQEAILSCIPQEHQALFQMGFEYGVRVGEARAMQWDCIKPDMIIIKRTFSDNELRETTKTGAIRKLPMTEYMQDVFTQIPKRNVCFVFVRSDGRPYTNKNLNVIWHKACNEAQIHIKLYNGFRHSLGCQLLDQGQGIDTVRDILGHTDSKMTLRYAKRNPSVKQEILENRRSVLKFTKKITAGLNKNKQLS